MEKTGKQYEDGAYYLHEQSINLCREDLEEVFHSKGLIGIQLDEKRIMGPLALQELKKRSASNKSSEQKFIYAKAVWANMFAAVDELKQVGVTNLAEAWNMFAIGSDFDGLINHLDSFESAAKIPDLRTAMGYFLLEPEAITLFQSGEISYTLSIQDLEILKGGLSNQELIEKIFFKNAMEFLKRNY
jgi:DNA polymerase/3'-5' exonuclease PolX